VERHGGRVWRIGLDGGFGCPHRQGGRGPGGCVYCAPDGSRSPYLRDGSAARVAESLDLQVGRTLSFLERRYEATMFFLYFQAFSSTFAPPDILRERYDAAICALERRRPSSLRGLVVSTRPDCVSEEVVDLLQSYAEQGLEVWVELGLQSAVDATLARIHRGHRVADFVRARALLKRNGIRTAAHLIIGLPGEGRDDILAGPRLLAELGVEGVKFHDLFVPRGSALAGEYLSGEITLLSPERYLGYLADSIEILPPELEVIRLCSDATSNERLAPRSRDDKFLIYRGLEAELEKRGSRQGASAPSHSAKKADAL
jgi:uncharacterized protein